MSLTLLDASFYSGCVRYDVSSSAVRALQTRIRAQPGLWPRDPASHGAGDMGRVGCEGGGGASETVSIKCYQLLPGHQTSNM